MPSWGMHFTAFALLVTAACSEGQGPPTTQIIAVGMPPVGGITDSATVPVGVVVGFAVVGSASSAGTATLDDATHVSLLASNVPGTYVLVGLSPGATTLRATADGATPTSLRVVAMDQASKP